MPAVTNESPDDLLSGRVALGQFVLDATAARQLTRDGEAVHLTQKPFRVLLYLLEHRHRLVTRGELLERFWPGARNEEALTRCVSSIRKALDDQGEPSRFVETRWAEGYRYIGPCEVIARTDPVAESGPAGAGWKRFLGARWMLITAALAVPLALGAGLYRARHPPSPPVSIHSIAVLPLQNLGDPAHDYFSDGLTDGLISALSRTEGISVIARGSTRGFTRDADPRVLGRTLGVPAFLTGSVKVSSQTVRVSVRLVDTSEGQVLWAFEAERPATDLSEAEDEVVRALAFRLSARLRTPLPARPRNEAAYGHYLRGRHLWQQRTEASLTEAITQFEAALRSDEGYAHAQLGLAESFLLLPLYAGRAPLESYPRAREAAEAALLLDPGSARAHAVLGVVASQFDWDWPRADTHFARAVALNPNDATALQWQAEAHCFRGQFDACAHGLRAARELDPLSPILAAGQGLPARFRGDTETALRTFHAVEKEWPDFPFVHYQLGTTYSGAGRWDEAIRHYRIALPAFGLNLVGGQLAFAYARSGQRQEALRLRDEMLAKSRKGYFPPVTLAAAEVGLGHLDAALDHLERALEVHDDFLVYMRDDPHCRDLRGLPRFAALQSRLGFTPSVAPAPP